MNRPPKSRQYAILLASVLSIAYLIYRATETLALDTPYTIFASLLLFGAEALGILTLLLYFYQSWRIREPVQPLPLNARTVDVFITTDHEDPAMLRATLEACVRLDYPHETYLIDDGKRPEVEALAKELGVHYIMRPEATDGRTGSLNYALERTTGEFIVILDADHVPEPRFITHLIGHFRDDRLAFIQTPHACYNFDSFQARVNHKARKFWDEGSLLARVLQPGRNRSNSAIYGGSAVMVRRIALAEIRGLREHDVETSIDLHRRGWKSLATGQRLVAGRAAPDIATFFRDRLTQTRLTLRTMMQRFPLLISGLNWPQRWNYLGAMLPLLSGFWKLALYLTPVLWLFSGVAPFQEVSAALVGMIALFWLITGIGYKIAGNGFASNVHAELFEMVTFWTPWQSLATQPNKHKTVNAWHFVWPQMALAIIGILALAWGGSRIVLGLASEPWQLLLPATAIIVQLVLIYFVTRRAFWPEDRRTATRHIVHLPITYHLLPVDPDGTRFGVTADLNDGGVGFIAYEVLPPNAVLKVVIRGAGQVIECEAQVRTAHPLGGMGTMHGYRYGCCFRNLSPIEIDALNRICLHYAVPRLYAEYDAGARDSWWQRLLGSRSTKQRRAVYRYPYHLPVVIYRYGTGEDGNAYEPLFTATEDLSRRAFAAVVEEPLLVGSQVGYHMQTPLGEVRGHAKVIRTEVKEFAGTTYHRVILEWGDFEGQGRTALMLLIDPRGAQGLAKVLTPTVAAPTASMRAPLLTGLLIAIPLIIVETGVFRYISRDDLFLREVARLPQGLLSQQQEVQLEQIYLRTRAEPHPNRDRLELLANALDKAGRSEDVALVRQRIANTRE